MHARLFSDHRNFHKYLRYSCPWSCLVPGAGNSLAFVNAWWRSDLSCVTTGCSVNDCHTLCKVTLSGCVLLFDLYIPYLDLSHMWLNNYIHESMKHSRKKFFFPQNEIMFLGFYSEDCPKILQCDSSHIATPRHRQRTMQQHDQFEVSICIYSLCYARMLFSLYWQFSKHK